MMQTKAHSRKGRDTYMRRLKAAGIAGALPEDVDARNYQLARRIVMAIDDWRGCPLACCRRARGCMAPHNRCSNAKPLPPSSPEEEARAVAQFHRMLEAAIAKREAEGAGAKEKKEE